MRDLALNRYSRLAAGLLAGLALSACSVAGLPNFKPGKPAAKPVAVASAKPAPAAEPERFEPLAYVQPSRSGSNLDGLIGRYSAMYGVPETLVHRVVKRESGYNPRARNGPNLGLMQIQYPTARSMGYRGTPEGLLDAETNLRYAVKYLRGAWIVGGRNHDQAVRNYSRGYYYDAKRQGLLEEVGLR